MTCWLSIILNISHAMLVEVTFSAILSWEWLSTNFGIVTVVDIIIITKYTEMDRLVGMKCLYIRILA